MKTFDLIVIGAGSGLDLAVEAAERGLKVAIVEKGPMGGTCLNRGCIPSKMVIHSAEITEVIKNSKVFGISSKIEKINLKKITNRANNLVDKDAKSIEKAINKGINPTLFKGSAKFIDKLVIEINNENNKPQKIKGKKIVISTGARPFIPPIEGLNKVPYMTSTEALRQTKLPKSMIIIGGGYIGVELGHFYASLGTKITIVQRNKLLIPREDRDVSNLFTKLWKKKYKIITNADAQKVEKNKKIILTIKKGNKLQKISADKLLISTGVRPNSDFLQLEKVGIKTNNEGFIKVNKFLETNIKNIWALGDVAGIYMFKHSANLEAKYVLKNILKRKRKINYHPMPHAIFTTPQIAGVGITEQEAKRKNINYVIGKYNYKNTGMGAALAEENGFVKLIVSERTKEILGCHIMGPHSSILLHQVLIAIKADKKRALNLLRNTVHIHPALNEVVQRAAFNVPI